MGKYRTGAKFWEAKKWHSHIGASVFLPFLRRWVFRRGSITFIFRLGLTGAVKRKTQQLEWEALRIINVRTIVYIIVTLMELSGFLLTHGLFDFANETMVDTLSNAIDSRAIIGQGCVLPRYAVPWSEDPYPKFVKALLGWSRALNTYSIYLKNFCGLMVKRMHAPNDLPWWSELCPLALLL